MSKKVGIDFSCVDYDEVNEKYWTPTSHNYFGSYGYAESRLATANYLSIGDVGDPDWREARRLPFGDEALEAFYPGSRGLSFIQYPWEHPEADDVDENPVTRMIDSDPTLEWALTQMDKFEAGSDKYNQLADLVSEIRQYNTCQIEEEAFIHAPSWAMDSLIYAQERSNDPEVTRIVEEFAPRKSMQGKVISTAMYPDTQSIKSMNDLHDEYEIRLPEGSREYCFALKDGKKIFGPYGNRYSALKFYRSNNNDYAGSKEFRTEQMFKTLHSVGITPVFDDKKALQYINHVAITPDNLLDAKKNYSELAAVINEANSLTSFIVQHINLLQEDIFWTKLKSKLIKLNVYDDVLKWSADLNKDKTPAPCLRAIGHIGLSELIEDYETIRADTYTRINTTYYILNVGKNTQVGITDSKELADLFKTGSSHDVLYFLMNKKAQDKLGPLSTVTEAYGFESDEYKQWVKASIASIHKDAKYSQESIQRIISQYNSSHRVKTVPSSTMREYGWLLGELPFTRTQITILSDCLEAYGRAIVAAQQNVPVIRKVFGRLKTRVEQDLINNTVPSHAIQSIIDRKMVNFVYKIRTEDVPTGKIRFDLQSAGLLSQDEINAGKYLDIELYYDYTFTNPSDVFRYVSNFAVTPTAIKLALNT
jgi:hypothetical protein